ncbi:MAG: DUF362 domain-containing protein [Candidatus Jordarchaeum sp.]|uniref:DUF362 domain-containing protein n=1 Tax=Candidatus Jordarchaeum sp. TaxID=2823881 RepID=UPI00404B8BCE
MSRSREGSRTKTRVVISNIWNKDYESSIKEIFNYFGIRNIIKNLRGKIYIKPNITSSIYYAYTNPDIVASLIKILRSEGFRKIFVMENCTQADFGRNAFMASRMFEAVESAGAECVFLDELNHIPISLDTGEKEYDLEFPELIINELVKKKGKNTYISMPKLKTHDITIVTLGVKNQHGLISDASKQVEHHYGLHAKLASMLKIIKPDFTIIDGEYAVGEGPVAPRRKKDLIKKYDILIGGRDIVAVDTVGAKVLGYERSEIKHLTIATDMGLGCGNLEEIEIIGDVHQFRERVPYAKERIYPPELNIKIVAGKKMACREGCLGQVESMLDMFLFDANGKGNFSVVAGKGFQKSDLENLPEPIVIVGDCAIKEVGDYLQTKYKDVRIVRKCSDITAISTILLDVVKPDANILADGMDIQKRIENELIAIKKGCNSIFMKLTN